MNGIESIKGPLMSIGSKFASLGIDLYFVADKRKGREFNPETPEDMLSIYPRETFNIIARSKDVIKQDTTRSYLLSSMLNSHEADIYVNGYEYTVVDDSNLEDTDFASVALDAIREYLAMPMSSPGLVVGIDETYIDTIVAKLDVIEELELRVANDICPYIFKYMKSFQKVMPVLKTIMNTSIYKADMIRLLSGGNSGKTGLDKTFTPVSIETWGDHHIDRYDAPTNIKLMYINLFICELINDLVTGKGSEIEDIEHIFGYFLRQTATESRLAGHIMLDQLTLTYVGKNKYGSLFHHMLSCIQNLYNNKIDAPSSVFNTLDVLRGFYIDNKETMNGTQIMSNNFLRKYAETHEIAQAIYDTKDLVLFGESILSTKEDSDRDMARVLDMSRRASLAEVELQFINTKYSKKDAINNAFIVIQEVRATMKKVKSQQAQDLLKDIENNLLSAIKASKDFDHKKERMTINIAYPVGYEG